MIVSIHQPGYIPWPGYFHRLVLSDVHVFFDDVQFEKNGFNNRNRIKAAWGPQWLTVPVLTKGRFGHNLLKDTQIATGQAWRAKHWRTLLQNYCRASHFEAYRSFFEPLYEKPWKWLLDLNIEIIRFVVEAISLRPRFILASDLRVDGVKSERVLNICLALGATHYISGALGRGYLEVKQLEAAGVSVTFQEYHCQPYPQLHGEFVPNLSMVDILFNCGPESFCKLMSGNQPRVDLSTAPKTKC